MSLGESAVTKSTRDCFVSSTMRLGFLIRNRVGLQVGHRIFLYTYILIALDERSGRLIQHG